VISSKQNAEHYIWGQQCDGWRLVDRDDLSVIHERMPANTSEVRHYHNHARQYFFVLSGEATMELDGQTYTIGAQQGIEVAPHQPHQMRNDSASDLEFLVISSPTTRGDRVAV
jgi:mannose-6-phosphate isomerase-like protein (cupin superfamily)